MASRFQHEVVGKIPPQWYVRTFTPPGAEDHRIRMAFPPGTRQTGAGRVVRILHPLEENPQRCPHGKDLRRLQTSANPETPPATLPEDSREARAARQGYRDFHGRGPEKVSRIQEAQFPEGGAYYTLGLMGNLWICPPGYAPPDLSGDPDTWPEPLVEFYKQDGCHAAVQGGDWDGTQIYLVRSPLAKWWVDQFDPSGRKRFVLLGAAHGIGYWTRKSFDKFEESMYCHRFGEDTGELPAYWYDRELAATLMVGGAYHIPPPEAWLKNASPGITN